MALHIPGGNGEKGWFTAPAGAGQFARTNVAEGADARDAKGVHALTVVAEGEAFLRQMLAEDAAKPGREPFSQRAENKIRSLTGKVQDNETRMAVEKQLQGTLEAVCLRHRDLTLRKHLQGCAEQLVQRREDVGTNLAILEDTALHSPDAALREQARKSAAGQAAMLHRAEQAMLVAGARYGVTPQLAALLGFEPAKPDGVSSLESEFVAPQQKNGQAAEQVAEAGGLETGGTALPQRITGQAAPQAAPQAGAQVAPALAAKQGKQTVL